MWSKTVGLLQRRYTASKATRISSSLHPNLVATAEPLVLAAAPPSPDASIRSYVSRAHPKPIPEFAVPTAMQMVLDDIEQRKVSRAERWEKNKDRRMKKGIQVSPARVAEWLEVCMPTKIETISFHSILLNFSTSIHYITGLWTLQKPR